MPKITKIGNSYGLYLSRDVLTAANLQPEDEVVVAAVQDGLMIYPKHSRRGRLVAAMQERMESDADTFRVLAGGAEDMDGPGQADD